MSRMSLRDAAFFVKGKLNVQAARILNAFRSMPAPLPLEEAARKADPPLLDLARLLEGRSEAGRKAAVEGYLVARSIPYSLHPYRSLEGSGTNIAVDIGSGEKLLILIAHHDAVPGSPGANDNASSVAVLLSLAGRLLADPPRALRVRLLFTGSEERCYLGAREYVKTADLRGLTGTISLELCGIGDTLVLWDVPVGEERSGLLRSFLELLSGGGAQPAVNHRVVGRIPLFGSDHRAFRGGGVPAIGLSILPAEEEEGLREMIGSPWKMILHRFHAPRPFDTYHRPSDRSETLQPVALELVLHALASLVRALQDPGASDDSPPLLRDRRRQSPDT